MLIRKLNRCTETIAGDLTRLRELLHPARDYSFSGRYSLAHATVAPEQASARHRLASNEVYYVLEGRGEMHIDEETEPVEPGDAVEIPAGAVQWIRNPGTTDLVFLCIVDPAWRSRDEDVLE